MRQVPAGQLQGVQGTCVPSLPSLGVSGLQAACAPGAAWQGWVPAQVQDSGNSGFWESGQGNSWDVCQTQKFQVKKKKGGGESKLRLLEGP